MTPEQEIKNYNKVKDLSWWQWALATLVLPLGIFLACSKRDMVMVRHDILAAVFVFLLELSFIGIFLIFISLRSRALRLKEEKYTSREPETEEQIRDQNILRILQTLFYKQRYVPLSAPEKVLHLCSYCNQIVFEVGYKGLFDTIPMDVVVEMKSAYETLGAFSTADILEKAIKAGSAEVNSEPGDNASIMGSISSEEKESKLEELTEIFRASKDDDYFALYDEFIRTHVNEINI